MKPPCHDNILSLCRITLGFDPVLAAVSPSTYPNKPDSTDLEWGLLQPASPKARCMFNNYIFIVSGESVSHFTRQREIYVNSS
ncbi:hypothetical protein BD769DRAFT_1483393 [Suillus cothurnatus]|nr:hypothetical protein BD769DRAFT_1483393 [Suillus cothurnatus]